MLADLSLGALLGVAAYLLLTAATRLALTRPPRPAAVTIITPAWWPGQWWVTAVAAGFAVAAAGTIVLTGMNHVLAAGPRHHMPGGAGIMTWVFAVVIVFGAWPLADQYTPGRFRKHVVFVVLVFTAGAWLADTNWLTTDLVTVIFVAQLVTSWQIRAPFAVTAVALLVVAAGYDAVQVFVTHAMTQEASTVTGDLPVTLTFPAHLALTAPAAVALGVGDIFLPGALAVTAGRISQRTGDSAYYRAAVAGYAAGLAGAVITLEVSRIVLPALVFLIPCVTVAVIITAARRHALNELTRNSHAIRQ